MLSSDRVLTLILDESQGNKCIRFAKESGIQYGIVMLGKGTVKSHVLNLLGIKSQKKQIVNFVIRGGRTGEVLDYLVQELHLDKPGHGIAYTTAILKTVGFHNNKETENEQAGSAAYHTEGESMFKKLTVIVERGMSDEVMEIARKAGVKGGTILHGRGAGAELCTRLFGIEIEPEKDLVIILTPSHLVDNVVQALSDGLQLDEPGKGILFIEPILETRGLIELVDEQNKS
ncbi:MAG: P-II family nitrogen regulator [Clostridiales bacterium]|nr:P-II family nitrogen regulator [Clostridiales bacterium]